MKRKFDIAYLIAKHNLAFTKMGPLLNCNFFSDSVNHCYMFITSDSLCRVIYANTLTINFCDDYLLGDKEFIGPGMHLNCIYFICRIVRA